MKRLALALVVLLAACGTAAGEPTGRTTTTVARDRHRKHEPAQYLCPASVGHHLRTGAGEARTIGHCRRTP